MRTKKEQKELMEAAKKYAYTDVENVNFPDSFTVADKLLMHTAFLAGAEWQKEKDEEE